jgi:hypothetical protein
MISSRWLTVTDKLSIPGTFYPSVTHLDILLALQMKQPIRAEDLGNYLWPHLEGRSPTRGGPTAANVTASRHLGKLKARGLVSQKFSRGGRSSTWELTSLGLQKLMTKERKPS